MNGLQRAATAAALVIGIITTLGATGASAADDVTAYGRCGDRGKIETSGALAHVTLSCHDGKITVQGWVKDTEADGQCAQVYGNVGAKTFSSR
ncbi:hypothetical protein [Allokutzneria sp. NRRL B-24872]|uniref:hypothetical protein n=1 Tax=Allokutzneria sp. NRRL B-24872 TaxID=1137961 RepID=UPI001177DD33|nr:hypothetical protein [Allokutzneria sp. NRRL B-24872]